MKYMTVHTYPTITTGVDTDDQLGVMVTVPGTRDPCITHYQTELELPDNQSTQTARTQRNTQLC